MVALPFLVGVGPIVFAWANNAAIVDPSDVVLPLALVTLVTAASVLALARISGDVTRSSVTVAIALVPLLTFGYQLDLLPGEDTIVVKLLVLAVNLVLAGTLIAMTWTRDVGRVAGVATVAAALFVALSVPRIVIGTSFAAEAQRPAVTAVGDGPDVYFIVLDAYARSDVLTEVYETDTSAFLDTLRDEGFYIADESYSNYAMSQLSLAATLNMRYLDDDAPDRYTENDNLIANAGVVREFLSHGYEYVFFETSWWGTDDAPLADVSFAAGGPGEFQQAMARATLPWRLLEPTVRHVGVLEAFEQLETVSAIEAPTFTFAHFLVPHPPYMFRADGSIRPYVDDINQRWERAAYGEQVEFVNDRISSVIETIIEGSDQPPIIIVQGDHGPMVTLGTEPAETVWWERHAILNAILAPEEVLADLYPSISPVNTFRVLLPHLFGGEAMPMLPDRSFFNWYFESDSDAVRPDPRELQEVTEALP